MILNQAQAEAVYSAMCALNNVAGRINCTVQETITVQETVVGLIYVSAANADGIKTEYHADQTAFTTAYGMN